MNQTIQKTCEVLNSLADFILEVTTDDRTLKDQFGWSSCALTRHDLANIPRSIASRLENVNEKSIPAERLKDLDSLPARITSMRADTIPYMFSGNSPHAVSAFLGVMIWLEDTLTPLLDWELLVDNKALPNALTRRLRSIQADLEALVPDKLLLEKQIKLINEATEAAESLPTDLRALREARATMNQLNVDSAKDFALIGERHAEVSRITQSIQELENEAKQLVSNCEEAYRITTTKGLAAAFDARARSLTISQWFWVGGLLIALTIGSWIGSIRLNTLTNLMTNDVSNWSLIWLNIILSILSIGAPLWFAWLATKQIGQRFRLSEDYAFKASVAKAYEGYRKEAARLDENLEHRLFSSALTRLEEAPLRLIEGSIHGSPWHEIASSDLVKGTIDNVSDIAKQTLSKADISDKSN